MTATQKGSDRMATTSATAPMGGRSFLQVPLGKGNIWVPAWSRRASMAGLALRAPCRTAPLVMHYASWFTLAAFGPRVLGRHSVPWPPRPSPDTWMALCDQWRSVLGDFDGMAVYEHPQRSRPGYGVLLLDDDRPVAFVKVHRDPDRGARSQRLLEAFRRRPSKHFHVPAPLGHGDNGGWAWMAMVPIPSLPHRPASRAQIGAIVGDIQERLRPVLSSDGVPGHWTPMHGDLTPWNVRRVGLRALWLLDWDEAGWGPPGADSVYYAATSSMLSDRSTPRPSRDVEAINFWRERIERRAAGDFDRPYNVALAERLASMEAS